MSDQAKNAKEPADGGFLIHVRRYASGETYSLTDDEIAAGANLDDYVDGELDGVAYVQGTFLCPLQAPVEHIQPIELIPA